MQKQPAGDRPAPGDDRRPVAARHVLIVDDAASVRVTLGELLHRAGYAVTLAGTSRDAFHLIARYHFDVLILELSMPDMSGQQLAAFAAVEQPDMPLIILTGHAAIESLADTALCNAAAYLAKTSDPRVVLERVGAVIEQRCADAPAIVARIGR